MHAQSGPFRWAVHDTSVSLRQKLCKNSHFYYGLSEGEKTTIQDQAWTI
jgi:hypothetical protein